VKVVVPIGYCRQAHQDGFDAPVCAQAKEGSAIVDEVELHVSAAADALPMFVFGGEWFVFAFFDDRQIGF